MAAKNEAAKKPLSSRTRSVVFIALCVAITAVSAWVTVAIGPVPFTLQMFAITFMIVVLSPTEAIAAIAIYLVLGAIGVPVFSGMRGGLGVLMGPSGGFLMGYLPGVALAAGLLWLVRRGNGAKGARAALAALGSHDLSVGAKAATVLKNFAVEIIAGIVFTAVSYVGGWAWYMNVAGVPAEVAFLTVCLPFIALDLCKIVAAVICAEAVLAAVKPAGK